MDNETKMTKARGFLAISPILIFLLFYLGSSIAIGDF